jgi:hypothetical protein
MDGSKRFRGKCLPKIEYVCTPRANPKIASYNATVKIYNTTSSLVRFVKKNNFLLHYKNPVHT